MQTEVGRGKGSTNNSKLLQTTFDDVEQVGTYAEVEIVAEEKDYERAKALVLKVAEELGMRQAERRSYLELLLARQRPTIEIATVRTVAEVRKAVAAARHRQLSVGFVPTMGALHDGHAALIDRARAECGFVVVSIFLVK